jgi:hypothetical protein
MVCCDITTSSLQAEAFDEAERHRFSRIVTATNIFFPLFLQHAANKYAHASKAQRTGTESHANGGTAHASIFAPGERKSLP